jgi:hypothetical protein
MGMLILGIKGFFGVFGIRPPQCIACGRRAQPANSLSAN